MTDEYLLEHGYKQYEPNPFDDDTVIASFQKRFDDEHGKKYFINIKKYSQDYVPTWNRDKWWKPFIYEYEMTFTMFEEEKTIWINLSSNWTLEEVEGFVENFFNTMKLNYYETWDEC